MSRVGQVTNNQEPVRSSIETSGGAAILFQVTIDPSVGMWIV